MLANWQEENKARLAMTSKELRPILRKVLEIGVLDEKPINKALKEKILTVFAPKVTVTAYYKHNYQTFRDVPVPFLERSDVSYYKHKFTISKDGISKEKLNFLHDSIGGAYQGMSIVFNGWDIQRISVPELEINTTGVTALTTSSLGRAMIINFRSVDGSLKISGLTFYDPRG